ncbi:MAG: hypothetical protein V7L21_28140 [Nostoc sp.]|uniref:hypothetical protein n=1 Tax=Nostoc sp. TaxID=1180 RepID=UPI002FF7BB8C
MNYELDWFDTGGYAEGQHPVNIPANSEKTIRFCEGWTIISGCSGYVTYSMNNTFLTIAFSNPLNPASNKLNIGTDGKSVWDEMDDHSYKTFTYPFSVGGESIIAECTLTGGDVNQAVVILKPGLKRERSSDDLEKLSNYIRE